MLKMIAIGSTMLLTGCTFNFTMAHTEGQATDLVDDTTTPTVTNTVTVPLKV